MFNKKYDFIAIDCEKASNKPASLCSIGIACFKHGKIKDTKEYIIKPYPFEFYNGAVINDTYHGVPLSVYENAPTIDKVWLRISKYFNKGVLVGHGINGDLQAVQLALEHYGIEYTPPGQNECVCTNIASIYTYPEVESHKLKALCDYLEIPVNPHHALSDAKAAGYLLLDMLNVTDCKTALDFIDICLEYNQIITTKYTDRNIEKYENKIKELFNHNDDEIQLIFKRRNILINQVIDYFYEKNTKFKKPSFEIINCISPIIEIYKNPNYSLYVDELSKLNPFTHDEFLYLKIDFDKYTLFFGLLSDKNDLIFDILMFLNKISIKEAKNNFYSKCYKEILKYKNTIYLLSNYMLEIEKFEEIDIYKYIEYIYVKKLEYFRSYDFEKQYSLMIEAQNTKRSIELFKKGFIEISKLIGVYLGIKEYFPEYISGIQLPLYFNGSFNLLDEIIEIFYYNKNEKRQYDECEYNIKKWYYENVTPLDLL